MKNEKLLLVTSKIKSLPRTKGFLYSVCALSLVLVISVLYKDSDDLVESNLEKVELERTPIARLVSTHGISHATTALSSSYETGKRLGERDAHETYILHSEGPCNQGITDEEGNVSITASGGPCIADPHGFRYFWNGYLNNVKNAHCNATTANSRDQTRGIVDGYHLEMVRLRFVYGGNYSGDNLIRCN